MSLVIAAKSGNRREFARVVMERFADCIPEGTVLVKPNVVSHEPYPTTTHPDMLDQVLSCLHGREVMVADGAAADIMRTGKVLGEHELGEVCEKHGLELIDVYAHPISKKKAPSGVEVSISELATGSAGIVSLPVLKVHGPCKMTGALKNHFGFLSKMQRGKLHFGRGDIHKAIAALNQLAPSSLVIVDAVTTLLGTNEVRHGGEPYDLGYLMAGTDPVALDAFGLTLLQEVEPKLAGLAPTDIPYIRHASEWGVGSLQYDVEWIEIEIIS